MKQAFLLKPGLIEIRDVPVPEPSEGEVVIKIRAALTCGTDLKAYERGHSLIPMPGPFGHEFSGTVHKTGKGVKKFKEGDEIMGVHSAPCLQCMYCRRGIYNLCENIMNQKTLGAFAEFILLPGKVMIQNLFLKPTQLSFEIAALLEPLSCVVHPYRTLYMDNIKTALVIGAGPIGLMHLAYLKMKGVTVIVSDFFDERLDLAVEMGAAGAVVPKAIRNIIEVKTDNAGVDLVIECTGQQAVWERSVNYVRRGGTVVLFGGCPAGTVVTYDTAKLHYDELSLMGSFHFTPADVKEAFGIIAGNKMDLSMLISGEYALDDIAKVFTLLKEGQGIKYAVRA
ncbi:MAG: alcohol dehydrogenase catalytic domain-containing protein [Nitrospiraceae bacterium]|nr:MAG: alcohol dehydrogenase catalytic domain-containing protein [Nitrospiraceae bacterium]